MTKLTDLKIDLPPHRYNDPKLTPKNFLLEVMHDETVDLFHRIQAASYALPFTCTPEPPAFIRVHPDLVIKVQPLVGDGPSGPAVTPIQ
jgi:hypothetical protein